MDQVTRTRISISKWGAAAVAALLLSACSPPGETTAACPTPTEAEVREAFEAWTTAYNARDIDGVMAIFDQDVVFEFQGAPNASYADLQRAFAAEFAQPPQNATWVAEPDTVMLSGEMANVISTWRQQVTANGTAETRQTNRAIDVLVRGPDCRWRITRSLNYPLAQPS